MSNRAVFLIGHHEAKVTFRLYPKGRKYSHLIIGVYQRRGRNPFVTNELKKLPHVVFESAIFGRSNGLPSSRAKHSRGFARTIHERQRAACYALPDLRKVHRVDLEGAVSAVSGAARLVPDSRLLFEYRWRRMQSAER